MYDTDMDDKMGLTRSPAKPPLQDDGLDIQATQAGVSTLPLPHCHCLLSSLSGAQLAGPPPPTLPLPWVLELLVCSQQLLVASITESHQSIFDLSGKGGREVLPGVAVLLQYQ